VLSVVEKLLENFDRLAFQYQNIKVEKELLIKDVKVFSKANFKKLMFG
jgi:hypothetical protein